jgi:dipeptidyl aminopeptidase/acylaminoacyl peptidase
VLRHGLIATLSALLFVVPGAFAAKGPVTGNKNDRPRWCPDGSRLAFVSQSIGSYTSSIWVMNADATGMRRVVADASTDYSAPAWSPDGTRIAFSSAPHAVGVTTAAVRVVAADAPTAPQTIAEAASFLPLEVAWPSTERVSYWAAFGGDGEIHDLRPDGSDDHAIVAGSDPSWSPDGRQLTYASGGTLWRAEGDGTDPVALATFDGRDTIPEASAWSPDGRSVAFLTGHPEFGIYYARSNAVWRVNSDGRDLRQLTPWKLDVSSPTWSPDSRELAFSALPALESPSDIFVVPADAARPRNVTHDNSEEASPQWSRAGLLAYVAREYDVFTISPDGTIGAI